MKTIKIGILLVGLSLFSYSNLYAQSYMNSREFQNKYKNSTVKKKMDEAARKDAELDRKLRNSRRANSQSNVNNNAPVLSIEDMGGYDMTSEENVPDMPSARENNKLRTEDVVPTEAPVINMSNLDAYLSKGKNGITIGDASGKSLIDSQLENNPTLSTPDYSGLAKSEAEMKKRIEDALAAKRNRSHEREQEKDNLIAQRAMLEKELANLLPSGYNKSPGAIRALQLQSEIDDLNAQIRKLEWEPSAIDNAIENNRKQYTTTGKTFENNIPWQEMSENMNPQRLTTVTNQLASLNGGTMPQYNENKGKSDCFYFEYEDGKTGTKTSFSVSKDGSSIKQFKESDLKFEYEASVPFVSANQDAEIKLTQSIEGDTGNKETHEKEKLDVQDAKTIQDLSTENNKWADQLKLEASVKGSFISGEMNTVHINEDGSAWKYTGALDLGSGELSGSIGLGGINGAANLNLAGGGYTLSYIQSPRLADDSSNGSFTITQKEMNVTLGGTLGVGSESKSSNKKQKVEAGTLVKYKVGAGLENLNTNKNINYMPDEVRKKVVYDYFGW